MVGANVGTAKGYPHFDRAQPTVYYDLVITDAAPTGGRKEGKSLVAKLKHHQQRNTKVTRRRLQTLQRRAAHLQEKPGSDRSAQFDEAELAALEWAIPILQQWLREDPHWVRSKEGRWRHLNWPFYERKTDTWYMQTSATERREATKDEIEQVKQGEETW